MLFERLKGLGRRWHGEHTRFVTMVLLVVLTPMALGTALTPFAVSAVDLPTREPDNPHLVLIGNSMVDTRIRPALLEDLVGGPVAMRTAPGSRSAAWYLMLRAHVEHSEQPAPVAAIFFRDSELTTPLSRTEGEYRRQILALSDGDHHDVDRVLMRNRSVGETFNARLDHAYDLVGVRHRARETMAWLAGAIVLADQWQTVGPDTPGITWEGDRLEAFGDRIWQLRGDVRGRFSYRNWRVDHEVDTEIAEADVEAAFPENPEDTFLPSIIELADANDIKVVFVRVSRGNQAEDLDDPFYSYMADLEEYVTQNDHTVLSMVGDPEISSDNFVDLSGHLSPQHQDQYTALFAERLRQALSDAATFAWRRHAVQ